MANWPRQTLVPETRAATPSAQTAVAFAPLGGFTPTAPDILSPPSSLLSTQNVWVRENSLQPRWRLSASSFSNPMVATFGNTANPTSTGTKILGAVSYGVVPVSVLSNTFLFAAAHSPSSSVSWSAASYVSSEGASIPPAFTGQWVGGAATYSAPLNTAVFMFGGSGSSLYAWDGTLSPPNFSRATGSPPTTDVVGFQNTVVSWHYLSPANRASWSVQGDPFDWTGLGSGYQDMPDINGTATRVFSVEEELILATDQEIWRGRYVGLPYVFDFSPIDRTLGVPYPRAALLLPDRSVVWLGFGSMIYMLSGEVITPIGGPVRAFLRDRIKSPQWAFFTYSSWLRQLRFFYCTSDTAFPTESVTFDFDSGKWFREVYGHNIQAGTHIAIKQLSASAFTWVAPQDEFLYTSAGTVGLFSSTATSDLGVSVEEDALFGTMLADNWDRRATALEARYDFAATSASSVTASLSTTFGKTSAWSQGLSVSANSNTSQIIGYPKATGGPYWNARVQSTNGSWRLRRVFVKFEDAGESR